MNANRIFTVLVEREGYNKQQAALLSKDLAGIAEEIRPLFEAWINSGDKPDYEYKGITLFNLISSTGMSYPAAVCAVSTIPLRRLPSHFKESTI